MISGFEQINLFEEHRDYNEAISCETYEKYQIHPLEDWMIHLVPYGEYVIHIGNHLMVLRPARVTKEQFPTGQRFYLSLHSWRKDIFWCVHWDEVNNKYGHKLSRRIS